jgi:hypothetical protein
MFKMSFTTFRFFQYTAILPACSTSIFYFIPYKKSRLWLAACNYPYFFNRYIQRLGYNQCRFEFGVCFFISDSVNGFSRYACDLGKLRLLNIQLQHNHFQFTSKQPGPPPFWNCVISLSHMMHQLHSMEYGKGGKQRGMQLL